ncbi:MAG: dephospho-CoA kinase [Eubacteriales bacterium]|nr:dephospho-CoA kinase [Eubacteriales bacterium]
MRVIGLTGGVGSGKSYVAHYLQERYQMDLLIADDLGHVAMQPGTDSYAQIITRFGTNVVGADGTLDRGLLAETIFHDPQAMTDMNAIIHPVVKSYIADYIQKRKKEHGTILLETAILYETGCDGLCDEVWYVYVPAEERIRRLMRDRGYTEEKSRAIMAKQQPDAFFLDRADRVIDNKGDRQALERILETMIPTEQRQIQGAFQDTTHQ